MQELQENNPQPENPSHSDPATLPEDLRKFMEDVSRIADAWAKLAESSTAGEPSPLWSHGLFVGSWLEKVTAAIEAFSVVTRVAERIAKHGEKSDPVYARHAKLLLENFDSALARIYGELSAMVMARAHFTHNSELMLEATSGAKGNGPLAAQLIRRYEELFPEDSRQPDGTILSESFPDLFAWDTYLRVSELDAFADEFPDHVRTAAIQMRAWPMLHYPHHDNRVRFKELEARLDLGAEYPLDASAKAKFRPDTPMIQYIGGLFCRLYHVWHVVQGDEPMSEADYKKRVRSLWSGRIPADCEDTVLTVLQICCEMPQLTKATALRWSRHVIVPMIMATDAQTPATCAERALQDIWRQKGVKSNATFKSRLLPAVSATLKRMARPG